MQTNLSPIPILGLLTGGPMTGYGIKQKIDLSLGNFWNESFGQIYPQLRAMEAAGLVTKISQGGESARGKKTYAITKSGRERLRKWLLEVPSERPPRSELLLKIFFALEGEPAVIRGYIDADRRKAEATLAGYETLMSCLVDMRDSEPRAKYWIMTLNYGITNLRAFLDWADDTIAQFADELQSPKQRRKSDA